MSRANTERRLRCGAAAAVGAELLLATSGGMTEAGPAASGRVGYGLREGAFFHRELPFVLAESDHPGSPTPEPWSPPAR